MEALLRWAAELGVSDSPTAPSPSSCLGRSLLIADFPDAGGRGLAAARDLRRGELVLRVPRAALFTSDRVMDDDPGIASAVANYRPRLSSIQTLIICLLAEVGKGKSSNWYLYLSQMPTYYTLLATFNDFESEALQVDEAIWVAQKALCGIRSDWEEATPLMKELGFKPKLLTLKSWIWAFATVSSRTLHIAWDDAGCLCPIGDLFNYAAPDDENSSVDEDRDDMMHQETNKMLAQTDLDSSDRLTDGGYESANEYCLYARKRYRKGEQVLLAYGVYTNLELLEHYGFLLSENPNEKVYIPLDLDLYTISTWPRDSLYILPTGHPSFALLCSLRLRTTPTNRRKALSHHIYSGSLLSVENELEVLKWLVKKCEETLQQLPSTIEFDESLLVHLCNLQNSTSCIIGIDEPIFEREFAAFFRSHGFELDCSIHSKLPVHIQRSLERWILAVQWRCSYKRTLTKCIAHCISLVHELSLQQNQQ
uniref:SET domain-containing protein n=1 Tax=Leersia perrieri TaxID=77586 RepID=A0A0D9WYP1_9ORYZ